MHLTKWKRRKKCRAKSKRARKRKRGREEGTFKQELLLSLAAIKSFFELLKFFFSSTFTANWMKKKSTKYSTRYTIYVYVQAHFTSIFLSVSPAAYSTHGFLPIFFSFVSRILVGHHHAREKRVAFCSHWYGLLGITTMRFINQCELNANIYMRCTIEWAKQERWREKGRVSASMYWCVSNQQIKCASVNCHSIELKIRPMSSCDIIINLRKFSIIRWNFGWLFTKQHTFIYIFLCRPTVMQGQ